MTIAYWCVLAAIAMPWLFVAIAKTKMKLKENRAPREYLERTEGWRQRAHWAQNNSFEILPGFAAAVIIAHQIGAPQDRIDGLAMAFIALRVLYGAAYISDVHVARSLLWSGGVACVVGLFFIGL